MNQNYYKGDLLKITKGTQHFDCDQAGCDALEDPSTALLKIELSISQINELERQLACKLAVGVDTLSKLLSDVARILEPKVKK